MSVFTNQFPILQENTTGNQKHLILSDTRITGASVNPAVEYVENYNYDGSTKKESGNSSVEIYNGVIYYPRIIVSNLQIFINKDNYETPYTDFYIVNQNDPVYSRKLNVESDGIHQTVINLDLRSNEIIRYVQEHAKIVSRPTTWIGIAAVRKAFDESGIFVDANNNSYVTISDSNQNGFYDFQVYDDGKNVDLIQIPVFSNDNEHFSFLSDSEEIHLILTENIKLSEK